LANKLGENLLSFETDNKYISMIPTKLDNGDYSMLFTYSEQLFDENLEDKTETLKFAEDINGKKVTVWCIDRETTNPCRMFQKNGWDYDLTKDQLEALREEGRLKPVKQFVASSNSFDLTLTANGSYLVTVEK
jgi:beta-xylosidase